MIPCTRIHSAALRALPAILVLVTVAGCATPPQPPRVLTVQPEDYPAVFDAAVQAARDNGLHPVVMDRQTGVIESAPRHTGSLVEPWRLDNDGLADGLAQTINFQRRRLRVEFVPADFSLPAPDPNQPVPGAAIPGSTRAEERFDLTRARGPVEMRTWVYLEREFRPNQRIGNWTLSQTRISIDPLDVPDLRDATTRADERWTPIGRDEPYERRIMAQIQQIVQRSGATP